MDSDDALEAKLASKGLKGAYKRGAWVLLPWNLTNLG